MLWFRVALAIAAANSDAAAKVIERALQHEICLDLAAPDEQETGLASLTTPAEEKDFHHIAGTLVEECFKIFFGGG
jgi:hypothetical protein